MIIMANENIDRKKIGIIADDLTGAGDSGIQFSEKGLETMVLFEVSEPKSPMSSEDVIVMNTESRSLPAGEAYRKAHESSDFLMKCKVAHLYKKIDSTLRGNWCAEIMACADAYKPDFIVVAPAYPEMGRTTMNGKQLLHGRPIEETQLANDPKTPVVQSNIADILEEQVRSSVKVVTVEELKEFEEKEVLNRLKQSGTKWLVFDAESEQDLQKAASMLARTGYRILWAGSAGLAKYLPELLEMEGSGNNYDVRYHDSPVLTVAGSTSEITKKQVQKLLECKGVYGLEMNPMMIFDAEADALMEEVAGAICRHLSLGHDAVLYSGSSPKQMEEIFLAGDEKGLSRSEVSNMISRQLGNITKEIVCQHPVRNMVLTGGDTAIDVYRSLGFEGMRLIKEIEPGIPLGQFIGQSPANVVTKAGAFGSEQSLIHAMKCLKKGCQE